jgi:hypothetical protein
MGAACPQEKYQRADHAPGNAATTGASGSQSSNALGIPARIIEQLRESPICDLSHSCPIVLPCFGLACRMERELQIGSFGLAVFAFEEVVILRLA